jgi:hypothetical protein
MTTPTNIQALQAALHRRDIMLAAREVKYLRLEQERDLLQALVQAYQNFIEASSCDPNITSVAWFRLKDQILNCKSAGVLPFQIEK